MGTIMLIGVGIFIGWLLFRPKADRDAGGKQSLMEKSELSPQDNARNLRPEYQVSPAAAPRSGKDHTLRNVAGGMVAGAVLGHMLTDKKEIHHETTNNYNNYSYNELYDHEDLEERAVEFGEDYEDYAGDYDYDGDDDYDGYGDSAYDDDYDYDSSSDWNDDSYDSDDW